MEWIVLWRRWAPPHNPPKKPTNAAQRATLINFFDLWVNWARPFHSSLSLNSFDFFNEGRRKFADGLGLSSLWAGCRGAAAPLTHPKWIPFQPSLFARQCSLFSFHSQFHLSFSKRDEMEWKKRVERRSPQSIHFTQLHSIEFNKFHSISLCCVKFLIGGLYCYNIFLISFFN